MRMPGAPRSQSTLSTGGFVASTGRTFLDPTCRACRGRAVPAEGSATPAVFIVGEAPGPTEEREGRPFVGRAGAILRTALRTAGWTDDELWITNIVKSFPFDLEGGKRKIRRPTGDEVAACLPHLVREHDALKPRLLVALGRTAAEALLGRGVPKLADVRGRPLLARAELGGALVFVTYHPSGLHYGHATVEEFTADLRAARRVALPETS